MGIQKGIAKHVNCGHIQALLWKDVLVRMRQPVSIYCIYKYVYKMMTLCVFDRYNLYTNTL